MERFPLKCSRWTKLLLAILILTLIAALSGGVYAKYIQSRVYRKIVKVPEYYFTSDYLTTDTAPYTLNEGTAEFSFELRNFAGEGNAKRISQTEIQYEITVEGGGALSQNSGKMSANEETTHKITLSDLTPGEYTVTVTNLGSYAHNLSAKLTVLGSSGVYKNTRSFDDYVLLTVWTDDVAAEVSITVPAGLIPDATDPDLTGKAAGDTLTLELEANGSRSYRFFTTGDYAGGVIPVKSGDITLDETTLN